MITVANQNTIKITRRTTDAMTAAVCRRARGRSNRGIKFEMVTETGFTAMSSVVWCYSYVIVFCLPISSLTTIYLELGRIQLLDKTHRRCSCRELGLRYCSLQKRSTVYPVYTYERVIFSFIDQSVYRKREKSRLFLLCSSVSLQNANNIYYSFVFQSNTKYLCKIIV